MNHSSFRGSIEGVYTNESNDIISLIKDAHNPSVHIGCRHTDMFVECSLYSNESLLTLPKRTRYTALLKDSKEWKTWIEFPIKYKDVTPDTQICFTVYDIFSPRKKAIIGGCTLKLFDDSKFLKSGRMKMKLWPKKKADYSKNSKTPGELSDTIDELTRIEMIAQENIMDQRMVWLQRLSYRKINEMRQTSFSNTNTKKNELFLNILLPSFEHPVMYFDRINENVIEKKGLWVQDPELGKENPVETQHLKLALHLYTGIMDKELQPGPKDKRNIQRIIESPPLQTIAQKDRQLLWKYRYWLCKEAKALTKFLTCVDWENEKEVNEAKKLIDRWSKIDTIDALVLLSKYFKGIDVVRNYAVQILEKAEDSVLIDCLLQLVQVLRYEKDMRTCKLADFLISRAENSFNVAHYLHWYLTVEGEDPNFGELYKSLHSRFWNHLQNSESCIFLERLVRQEKLYENLNKLCNQLKEDRDSREVKIKKLGTILKEIEEGKRQEWNGIFNTVEPLALPVNPNVLVTNILPEKATIFKSSTSPILLSFSTTNLEEYKVIFKGGDDLRQDQLIIQIIQLMDKLLKKNGLDLKLTPYHVLACSTNAGFLECVYPSTPISKIIEVGNQLTLPPRKMNKIIDPIRKWLWHQLQNEVAYQEACNNFVKSCAGYCVITYILGIGDRHLDNLLLTPNGNLFHIDFGFILGRDPKPFPPPMKLCKEMVDGMGGSGSKNYETFLGLCCSAYNVLRKYANLIIYLFVLMIDARIPDIEGKLGSDPMQNIMKVQEKFKLELTDEEAIKYMQSIIIESERALFPKINDTLHRWAQYWKD